MKIKLNIENHEILQYIYILNILKINSLFSIWFQIDLLYKHNKTCIKI